VDVEFFTPHAQAMPVSDLVFVGSMDWLPNIDAMQYFVAEVLPLIREHRPDCSLAIVGRKPPPRVTALTTHDRAISVTGTVADVRPYLWGSSVAIVPLRIGGGTRLKIFEAMAARIPVVSTTIGAEGLDISSPREIRLADTAADFAKECLRLLENPIERKQVATAAWQTVSSRFSWDAVVGEFETIIFEASA
jgi:glycosyltransferase involved in cell wall biosynthesis